MNRLPLMISCVCLVSLACSRPSSPNHDAGPALIASAHAAAPPSAELDPSAGEEIGLVYEAFLSPMQEPAEESDTPKTTPTQFRSTTASKTRAERVVDGHRGHGQVRFSKDLSRAYVDVKIEGVAVDTINMFHIHCGKPGKLGPILVDFGHGEHEGHGGQSVQANFVDDGVFSVEVTNADIVATVDNGHGAIGAFTAGCMVASPSLEVGPPSKVSTVAGMAAIAAEGDLYFNLHTTGQTYYGDIRGQLGPARD